MHLKLLSILVISIGLFSCGDKNSDKSNDTQKPDLLADVPFRKAPVVDSTNFDNFNGENALSEELISKLQLRKIEGENLELGVKELNRGLQFVTLKVYKFPFINVLWIGTFIMAVGLLMSMMKRIRY